jgi:hypothetical protein
VSGTTLAYLNISRSWIGFNYSDGIRFQYFNELSISDTVFQGAGEEPNCSASGSGLYLQCKKVFKGTAKLTNVTAFNHRFHGIRLEGLSTSVPIQDILISSTQSDFNGWNGIYISNGRNVSISSSSVTSNGLCTGETENPQRAGMYVKNCSALSISGFVVAGNARHGMYLRDVLGGSLGGITFNSNNAAALSAYALFIDGGAGIAGAGLSFANEFVSGLQNRGIVVTGNTRNLSLSGISMYDGMIGPFVTASGNPTGNGVIRWIAPGAGVETATAVTP